MAPDAHEQAPTRPLTTSPRTGDVTNILTMIDPTHHELRDAKPEEPQLRIDDLVPFRGDGIFETVLVTVVDDRAHVHASEPHFSRFIASAFMLDLPEPQQSLWEEAIESTIAQFRDYNPDVTAFSIRYALSRGVLSAEGVYEPTGWVQTIPLDPHYVDQRREGVASVTLDRGYHAYMGQNAPWLLIGAKTLSYATNQAAGRAAHTRGADEPLFVSHDGIVLEGPTSNIVIKRGYQLLTPNPQAGLLHGTTQRTIFTAAAEAGYECSYADLTVDDVKKSDGAWMVSSVRMAVPVTSLDGADLARDAEFTDTLVSWVLAKS